MSKFYDSILRRVLTILGLVAIMVIVTSPYIQTVAHAAVKSSKFGLQINPQAVKPPPAPGAAEPDYCLSVIINSGNKSIASYSDGVGQNYEVIMKVVNTCGVGLTSGGKWNFSSQVHCSTGDFAGFYFNGALPAMAAGSTQTVVDRSRTTYCTEYNNGVEIARTLPIQITFYGNAASSYKVGPTTTPAEAHTGVATLY